jgi:poly(beta-D-mannuronate) lyase
LVEGNFFFGENSKSAGGVRIIGERHRVTGNYFQDLGGLETRAALCLVNGLKDSPLNGYFQVRDALITRNTWVNCRQPIYIGQTDEDRGNDLAPQGVVFTGNEILGKTAAVTIATPGEIRWEENVVNSEAALPTAIPGIRVGNLIIETEPKFRDGQGPLQPSQTGPDWR